MTEGTPTRCVWIARDDQGRPRCEHGWAKKTGPSWRCPRRRAETVRRYAMSEKGRATKARWNLRNPARNYDPERRRSTHALYDLTRVK